MKQLRNVETALANFFASGVLRLEEKLGPILWQFPARMSYDEERFHTFLALLPGTSRAAAHFARKHDRTVSGRSWLRVAADRPLYHAIEVRHPSFFIPEFVALLRHYNAAFVVSDSSGEWPSAEDVTASFVYVRLHGSEQLYASGYHDAEIERWARRVNAWRRGREPHGAQRIGPPAPRRARRDVFVYFDNDAKVRAPFDARRLIQRVESGAKRKAA